MAATRLIALHINKGLTLAKCLAKRCDYTEDYEKTDNGKYISSYECNPMTVSEEFLLAKAEYQKKTGREYRRDVIAYQIRQSFRPGEITPEEANRIGYELALRFTKGRHAFTVSTHVDKKHIHNHIIFNSTNLSCDGKFRDFMRSGIALQKLSDTICLENGLSVIKPRPYNERAADRRNLSKKPIRDRGLDMLIDVEKKLREGKGAGYERWAKVFNVKQMSRSLLFLQENGIRDYDELVRKCNMHKRIFDELSEKMKPMDERLSEIAALQKHIINYSKTRDVYVKYRKSGYSKKFLEEHREEILLHKAAKVAFSKIEGGSIPKMAQLRAEYGRILSEKKKTYEEYRRAKEEFRSFQIAKKNMELMLQKAEAEEKEQNQRDEKSR